jgi:putative lipoic acid-binding regulatory protein
MQNKFDKVAFKEKLEAVGAFPMLYMFKFIVPSGKEEEIGALFPNHQVTLKPSSGGKYVSTTVHLMAESADFVIEVYERASQIEGVISL